jgi:hypothetical protein
MHQMNPLPDPPPKFLWPAGMVALAMVILPLYQCKRALDQLGDWPGENAVVKEMPSPDGRLRLVEYIRRHGVSSTDIREFSVLGAKEPLPDAIGNAFRLNAEVVGAIGFPESRKSPVTAKWTSFDRVEISHPSQIEVIGGPTPVWVDFGGIERRVEVSARVVRSRP